MARHPQLCLFFQCSLKMSSSVPQMSLGTILVTVAIQMIEACRKRDFPEWMNPHDGRWPLSVRHLGWFTAWSSISRADFQPLSTMCGVWGHSAAPCPLLPGWTDLLPRGARPLPAQLKWVQQLPSLSARLRAWLLARKTIGNRRKHLSLEALLLPKSIFTPILI